MDVIDQKGSKGENSVMNELKLHHDQLESSGKELAYFSREMLQLGKG